MKKILFILPVLYLFTACSEGIFSKNIPENEDLSEELTPAQNENENDNTASLPAPEPLSTIRFDVSGAIAILKTSLTQANNQTELSTTTIDELLPSSMCGLLKMNENGELIDLCSAESPVEVANYAIASDGNLYLSFETLITANDEPCYFLRVLQSNEIECIDRDYQWVKDSNSSVFPNHSLQFDDLGNLYYKGRNIEGSRSLRKYDSEIGGATKLINENILVSSYLAQGSGMLYYSGTSTATTTAFLRRLLPDGTHQTLMNGLGVQSMYELPDGNVYVGVWGEPYGILRITEEGIAESLYIGYTSMNGVQHTADFYTDDNEFHSCSVENRNWNEGFCGFGGTGLSYFYKAPDDRVFVVAGSIGQSSIWQYWPIVRPVTTSIYRPSIVKGVENALFVAGYDQSYEFKLISFDLDENIEMDLLNGEEIEIYHFSHSQESGMIAFDGLRISDNTYMIGFIDTLNENNMTVLDESVVQYEDIQFFK